MIHVLECMWQGNPLRPFAGAEENNTAIVEKQRFESAVAEA